MPEETKDQTPTNPPEDNSTRISPAPSEVTDGPLPAPGENATPASPSEPPAEPAREPIAEPLSDGTVPSVLKTGSSHRKVAKSHATMTSMYRRADVLTTVFTFIGAFVAAGIILGAYAYFTRNQDKPAEPGKVTKLDTADLEKLSSFFSGNSAGTSAEVLTVGSSSLFKGRVAIASDLKVVGGTQIDGTTTLGALTVDKTATLGVTHIRGQFTVAGPTVLQSPATLAAGASIKGDLSVTGNGSFGGSLSAGILNIRDLTVSNNLNLAGHLVISGQTPSVTPEDAGGPGTTVSIVGNDSGGTVTVNSTNPPFNVGNTGGQLITIKFRVPYSKVPRVIITPVGRSSAILMPYISKTADSFTIGASINATANTSYTFDYWVVQ